MVAPYFPKIVAFDVILPPTALTCQNLAVIKGLKLKNSKWFSRRIYVLCMDTGIQYCAGDKTESYQLGWACGTYG